MSKDAMHDLWLELTRAGDETTSVLEITDIGCLVKVTKGHAVAMAFVPDVMVVEEGGRREIVAMPVVYEDAETPAVRLSAIN